MENKILGVDISNIYNTRFSVFERVRKNDLWKIFCQDFLQQFISSKSTVLDIGSGSCEFINNIRAKRKIALDLNPITVKSAKKGVIVVKKSAEEIDRLFPEQIDVAFMSNFLEHLESKYIIHQVLKKTYLALKPGGRLLILQPDIKLVGNQYWDFFDHITPITKNSLIEVLISVGYEIKTIVAPFLPYTTNTRFLPYSSWLLKIYLKCRPLQLIFGKQIFIEARR